MGSEMCIRDRVSSGTGDGRKFDAVKILFHDSADSGIELRGNSKYCKNIAGRTGGSIDNGFYDAGQSKRT